MSIELAAAAGHSSISLTMKYVHPQKSEIWQALERKSGSKIGTSRRRQIMKVEATITVMLIKLLNTNRLAERVGFATLNSAKPLIQKANAALSPN
jgi:hypothetical protein